MDKEPTETFTVRGKITETPAVVTLLLSLADGSVPAYAPGQFITVYFPELGTPQGKAYSISSAPSEKHLAITVKRIGEFSNRLCDREPGDALTASLPYGYFYSESDSSALVMAAGGIGITPFRAMIKDSLEKNPSRKLALFYGNRTEADIVFKDFLRETARANPALRVAHFITRETPASPGATQGRMNAAALVGTTGLAVDTEYLLCGSIPFVRDLWRALTALGVPEDRIYTEAFFSH